MTFSNLKKIAMGLVVVASISLAPFELASAKRKKGPSKGHQAAVEYMKAGKKAKTKKGKSIASKSQTKKTIAKKIKSQKRQVASTAKMKKTKNKSKKKY